MGQIDNQVILPLFSLLRQPGISGRLCLNLVHISFHLMQLRGQDNSLIILIHQLAAGLRDHIDIAQGLSPIEQKNDQDADHPAQQNKQHIHLLDKFKNLIERIPLIPGQTPQKNVTEYIPADQHNRVQDAGTEKFHKDHAG